MKYDIYKRALVTPITSAECERSFSALKRIQTYLRATMGQNRLNSMAILSIESKIAAQIDIKKVLKKFVKLKGRKIELFYEE